MLELEIQSLLILHGSSDGAARALYEKYKGAQLNLADSRTISQFFLAANLPATAVDFCVEQIQLTQSAVAWAHFAEALLISKVQLSEEFCQTLFAGAKEQHLLAELAKSQYMIAHTSELEKIRDDDRKIKLSELQDKKYEVLSQLETLQSQDMLEAEGELLNKALKMFPRDIDLQERHQKHKEKLASRVLDKRNQRKIEDELDQIGTIRSSDPDTIASLNQIHLGFKSTLSQENQLSILRQDFAIAHLMWGAPELAIELLRPKASQKPMGQTLAWPEKWLFLDAELQSHRYLDLLNDLIEMEKEVAHLPDATLSVQYLRAIAIWRLGQKNQAYTLLEQIASIQPHFLDVTALLERWKRQLK